jgi:NAD+ kinase
VKLGLVVHRGREEAVAFAGELISAAERLGLDAVVEAEGGSGPGEPVDLLVAVGGDGTMLDTVRHALALDVPVIGFNLGTIGFLAAAEREDASQVMAALASGDYRVVERSTVQADMPGGSDVGLNDVVVEKIDSQRLVELDLEVDGHHFLRYRADGVVFSTPTGSTAYGFSAGGPLMDPRMEALLVTPVAAHSLFGRTVVVPAGSEIRCRVARNRPVQVSVDGRVIGTLSEGDGVTIRRGPRPVRFVEVEPVPFTTQVRRKFGLG